MCPHGLSLIMCSRPSISVISYPQSFPRASFMGVIIRLPIGVFGGVFFGDGCGTSSQVGFPSLVILLACSFVSSSMVLALVDLGIGMSSERSSQSLGCHGAFVLCGGVVSRNALTRCTLFDD